MWYVLSILISILILFMILLTFQREFYTFVSVEFLNYTHTFIWSLEVLTYGFIKNEIISQK